MREKLQDQGLYLLQLWADAFMMYQDTYPGFHKYYRELKFEGIKFPKRDINEETIMENFSGISSPMFDFFQQAEKKRNEETPTMKVISSIDKEKENINNVSVAKMAAKDPLPVNHEDEIEMDPDTEIADINIKLKELEDQPNYVEDHKNIDEQVEEASYKKYEEEKFDNAIFELSKRNVEILTNMLQNFESYTDMCTEVVMEMYYLAVKGILTCEKVLKVRKMNKLESPLDNEAKEIVTFMHSQLNDYKERYFQLKDKQIRQYNKAKKRIEKKMYKLNKEQAKQEKKDKKKQDKLEARLKKESEVNPFDVKSEESKAKDRQALETTILSDYDTESSHSDSSESEASSDDSCGLNMPKSMHEIRCQQAERQRCRDKKRRSRELTKIIRAKEKKSQENKSTGGGFLRNSVLVQRTLNLFSRTSKVQQVKITDSDDDDKEDLKLNSKEIKSDSKPEINDFFVQTATKKVHSDDFSGEKENIFDIGNKEIDVEYFQNNKKENEEIKEKDKQIFVYTEKPPTGLPPLNKSKKNMSRQNTSGVKKLTAPPKNEIRHSVLQKFDLIDLFET